MRVARICRQYTASFGCLSQWFAVRIKAEIFVDKVAAGYAPEGMRTAGSSTSCNYHRSICSIMPMFRCVSHLETSSAVAPQLLGTGRRKGL